MALMVPHLLYRIGIFQSSLPYVEQVSYGPHIYGPPYVLNGSYGPPVPYIE